MEEREKELERREGVKVKDGQRERGRRRRREGRGEGEGMTTCVPTTHHDLLTAAHGYNQAILRQQMVQRAPQGVHNTILVGNNCC